MLSECSWLRITAGQKDYAGRMKLMEQSRNEHYAALGMPPGPPTNKGIWGEPETTGQALTNATLGNYDIPDNWPQPPVKNEPGDVPGPPVQCGPAVNPEAVAPGYGFTQSLPQREDDIYFYHSDHLGSTSYVTDADANPTQFVCYMPFGEAFVDEHTTRPGMPYKFNGKEQDQETGLYYYGARYYDPRECRFYGVDVMAEKYANVGGYVYCNENPLRFVDPDGMDWYENKNGNTIWREGSSNIKGYTNIGENYSIDLSDGNVLQFKQSRGFLFTNTNKRESEDLPISTGKKQEVKEALGIASNLLTPGLVKRDILSPIVVALSMAIGYDPKDIDRDKVLNYSKKLDNAYWNLKSKGDLLGNKAAKIASKMENYNESSKNTLDYQKLKYDLNGLEKKINRTQSDMRHIRREQRRINASIDESLFSPTLM